MIESKALTDAGVVRFVSSEFVATGMCAVLTDRDYNNPPTGHRDDYDVKLIEHRPVWLGSTKALDLNKLPSNAAYVVMNAENYATLAKLLEGQGTPAEAWLAQQESSDG